MVNYDKHNWSFTGFRRPNLNFVLTNSQKKKNIWGIYSLLFNLRANCPDLQRNPCGYYVLYSSSQHLFEMIFAPINFQGFQLPMKSDKYRSHCVKPYLTSLRFQENDNFLKKFIWIFCNQISWYPVQWFVSS